jgi:hypothetical protein
MANTFQRVSSHNRPRFQSRGSTTRQEVGAHPVSPLHRRRWSAERTPPNEFGGRYRPRGRCEGEPDCATCREHANVFPAFSDARSHVASDVKPPWPSAQDLPAPANLTALALMLYSDRIRSIRRCVTWLQISSQEARQWLRSKDAPGSGRFVPSAGTSTCRMTHTRGDRCFHFGRVVDRKGQKGGIGR